MHFTIAVEGNSYPNILRAELSRRETAEEMHEFIRALKAEIRQSGCGLTLIRVVHSRPIFTAEHYVELTRLAANPGIRIALGAGWSTLVAAELIAATRGLGFMIQSASQFLNTDLVVAGILVVALVALLIEIALRRVQHHLSPWLGRIS